MMESILFYTFAGVIGVSAIFTVTCKNIFHSALYLGSTLFGVAALYVLLNAHFLAAIQVLIYIGAVVVLTIFVINLTKKISGESLSWLNRHTVPAGIVAVATFALMLISLFKVNIFGTAPLSQENLNNTAAIGQLFLSDYLIPFEVVSVLLLASLIGAIVIVSKDNTEEK